MVQLVENQRDKAFIDLIVEGKSVAEAGKALKIADPDVKVNHLIARPEVRQYVFKHLRGRVEVEAAPAAYKLLYRTMVNEKIDLRIRIDIAKHLFNAAGYIAPKAQEAKADDLKDKEPSQMSSEELRRSIVEWEGVLAARAKPTQQAKSLDDLLL